jgi:prepilin signal peptidase PulO-like enzyme (type II secretory pathway)
VTQLILALFFVFGTAVGSFLNVIAYRSVHGDPTRPDLKKSPRSGLKQVPRSEATQHSGVLRNLVFRSTKDGIFFGNSVCPKCKHKLAPVDLVPIVSFLLLGGHCRYCHKKISFQYPVVEFVTGVLFALAFYSWYHVVSLTGAGLTAGQDVAGVLYQGAGSTYSINFIHLINLIFLLFIISTLVVLFVTDLRDGLLPNSIVLPAIMVVGLYKLILAFSGSISVQSLSIDLVASLLVAGTFFAIVYLSRERALGGGDIKFVFLVALAVGWPLLLVALWLAFLTGGAVAAMLILTRKKRFGQTVPLGPFLAIGALAALFWGQQIIDLYLKGLYR